MPLTEQIKQAYALEAQLCSLRLRSRELSETVKQAKYTLRTARAAQVEYGGLSAFLDKLSGKYPDKAESLDREVRRAEAELNSLLRLQEENAAAVSEITDARSVLPARDALKQTALEQPDTARLWATLELRLLAAQLLPLLKKNEANLLEYRSLLRGEYPILSPERQQQISTEPDVWAQQCAPVLEQMQPALAVLGQTLEICPYFRSPAYFLASAAAQHNRINRAAQALEQVQKTRTQANHLLETLPDIS